ncbi:mycofactocin biosynthesis peptidyl-dipeptidase MftE [Streptomyces sp. NPDC059897]|uniref:mycofactocin biosynthesis peptidyl-dipeptidase MftE n=1 Tax=Streptomyces sp. NPDC059897 TaxID=3346994 RepID=UPI003652A543
MPEPVDLARATWTTVPEGSLVLVPVGSTEQHGPHLPLNTDSVIAEAVARDLGRQLPYEDVVLVPTLTYGASGEHAGFPGTLSIGHEALHAVLVETTRSLALWAGRVVLVNGHGGNVTTLDAACAQLRHEGHDVAWLGCAPPGGDAHAGRTETSVMLHLAPDDVRLSEAAPGDTRPLPELLPHLIAHGVRGVSPNGVLGDPTGATAEEGRELIEAMVSSAAHLVTTGCTDPRGRLLVAAPQGAA